MTSTPSLTPLRHAAPTVTLEVMAREAAVSQWSDKPVVQVMRYQLQIRSLSGEEPPLEIRGDRASFLPLMAAVQDYVQAQLTGTTTASDRAPHPPYLEPQGLTQHTLHLGDSRTTTGDSHLRLGAVQLADLAQVLAELDQAVRPLPVSLVPTAQRRPWRQWGAAAAGIVAAVGVTTALWPNYTSQQSLETASDLPAADSVPPTDEPELEALEERSPQPAAIPEDDSPAAASTEAPAAAPGEDVAPEAQSSSDRAESALAPPPENDVGTTAPSAPDASRNAPLTDSDAPPAPTADAPAPPAAAPPRTTARTPADAVPGSPPTELSESAPPPAITADSAAGDAGATADAAPEAFSLEESPAATTAPPPGSLADLIAQVRDRWTPPDDLDRPLIYRLIFAEDGTLTDVIPDSDLAAEYRDRTGIPPTGTAWRPADLPPQVEIQLQPDGSVEWREVSPTAPQ